jgi:hypothetical protein
MNFFAAGEVHVMRSTLLLQLEYSCIGRYMILSKFNESHLSSRRTVCLSVCPVAMSGYTSVPVR